MYESGDYYFTKNKYRAVTNIKCDFKTPQTLEGLKAWCDAKPNCQGFDRITKTLLALCPSDGSVVQEYETLATRLRWLRKKSSIKGNVFDFFGCERPSCCTAKTLSCLSCQAKLSIKEF